MTGRPAATSFAGLRAAYLVLQGAGIMAWWGWLFSDSSRMRLFLPSAFSSEALVAFFPADVALALASLATAWLVYRGHAFERSAAWFVAGCAVYATLWCVGIWLLTGEAFLGAAMMVPCAFASVACAVWARRS